MKKDYRIKKNYEKILFILLAYLLPPIGLIYANLNSENKLRACWDNIKHTKIHITGASEGEERKKSVKNVFDEIMAENISLLLINQNNV